MTHFLLNRVGLLVALLLVGLASALHAQTITTFDPPNSTSTYPTAINLKGQITGWYTTGLPQEYAFLREPDGSITTFPTDPICPYHPGCRVSVVPNSINALGWITGLYTEEVGIDGYIHSFVRDPNGTITIFDVIPDPGRLELTTAQAINRAGKITGSFVEAFRSRGFLRQRNGTISLFGPVGSQFTYAQAINAAGQITGYYSDNNSGPHGFLRQGDGTFITFDPPGSLDTKAIAINNVGRITGYYSDGSSGPHGFLRLGDGTISTFDPTGSLDTRAIAISNAGWITGYYSDANYAQHGFLRKANEKITSFDALGTASKGTFPTAISPAGQITGHYQDANSVVHGFVRSAR